MCDSYLSKLHEDEECYKLNRLLNVKSQEMPVNMKKRNEYGTASPNQIYWWTWAEQQFFKQHHANYFFEPETWNSYAEMNDLPTVEVPKQPPLDYDVIDSFKDDHESH